MTHKIACPVCGTEFIPCGEAHYIARDDDKTGLAVIVSNPEPGLYDGFDCPQCGCQVITQSRKRQYRPEDESYTDDDGECEKGQEEPKYEDC